LERFYTIGAKSETQDTEITVKDLIDSGETSLALDYYRKLCGTCHLWKQKNNMEGLPTFFNEKGGGCSACHFVMPQGYERATITESNDEIIDDDQVKIHRS
jgi:hypothetical protein